MVMKGQISYVHMPQRSSKCVRNSRRLFLAVGKTVGWIPYGTSLRRAGVAKDLHGFHGCRKIAMRLEPDFNPVLSCLLRQLADAFCDPGSRRFSVRTRLYFVAKHANAGRAERRRQLCHPLPFFYAMLAFQRIRKMET